MKRVTEPELMTARDQVQAYAEADFSSSENDLIEKLVDFVNQHGKVIDAESLIVDLGCGPGNISKRLAAHWPQAKILGIDDSLEMLSIAKHMNSKTTNISFRKINIASIANGTSGLLNIADVVVSNSLIHHLHDPGKFFDALLNLSKEGTIHYHRDLCRPSSLKEVFSLQRKHLPKAPSILIRDFIASLKAAYSVEEILYELKCFKLDYFKLDKVADRYFDLRGVLYKK